MKLEEAKKRAEKLRSEIRKHRYNYHVLNKETISPQALDSLKKELFDLEKKFPKLVNSNSPTQRVGGEPLDKFNKVEHEVPMLSFNDAFNRQDMNDWLERLDNHLGYKVLDRTDDGFFCELKFDGLAVELVYDGRSFVQGSTRGDGEIGEDVTRNLKTIDAIPLKLREPNFTLDSPPDHLVVRGEVFMGKDDFKKLNKRRKKEGEKAYANPRNVAAGTIRQLDPKVVSKRNLDFFAYDIAVGVDTDTHGKEHEVLKDLGFKVDPNSEKLDSIGEVESMRNKWAKKRDNLPYEVDGIVVQINETKIFKESGVVGKAPRAAIAFKFPPREATTKVKNIKVQVGRTGALTPVAVLEPVEVGGVTISHASLHNEDQIEKLGVKIGDTAIVSRAGDVIPQVTKVLKDMRSGDEKSFEFPDKCPIDGSDIVKDGAILRCSNSKCGARHREQLYHFVSRAAFDIDGVGPKVIDTFMENDLISDFADLFEIERGDIVVLEGFGEKSADNIISSIESSKVIDLPRFIYSLGILHVGGETSQLLADKIIESSYIKNKFSKAPKEEIKITPGNILDVLKFFSMEELKAIEDIGPEVAKSIYQWVRDETHVDLMERLDNVGVRAKAVKPKRSSKLKNKTFVLTGSLESMTRDEAKNKIRRMGGKTSSSVSSNTDYLVVGESPGSTKVNKAKEINVEQIAEDKFLELLEE